jgi:hypothetical protein
MSGCSNECAIDKGDMSQNTSTRFLPSAAAVADLAYIATAAFPTWAVLVSSAYLMLISRFQFLAIRRMWNG